jgi:hypothetical protein
MSGTRKRNHPAFLSFAAFAMGIFAPAYLLSRSRHDLVGLIERFGDDGLVAMALWPAAWYLIGFAFGWWGAIKSFRGFGGRLVAFASIAINLVFFAFQLDVLWTLRTGF